MKSLRRTLPFLLIAFILLVGGLHLWGQVQSYGEFPDQLSAWEKRMVVIRATLPEDVLVAGYLDKASITDIPTDAEEPEFFMAQYGMAPVVLTPGIGPEWLIGNFGNSLPAKTIDAWLSEKLGNYTVQELGFGIYLIHDTAG